MFSLLVVNCCVCGVEIVIGAVSEYVFSSLKVIEKLILITPVYENTSCFFICLVFFFNGGGGGAGASTAPMSPPLHKSQ